MAEIDPEGTLPPAEAAKRLERAKRAHFIRLRELRTAKGRA